jgi:hypothetical protein
MEEITKGKKKTALKMGYMDTEGSGLSLAVKEQHPPQDLPTALSSPPTKFVLPEPSTSSSDSDFEVMCYRLNICILASMHSSFWQGGQEMAARPRRTRRSASQTEHAKPKNMSKSDSKKRSLSQPAASSASERPSCSTASQVWHFL